MRVRFELTLLKPLGTVASADSFTGPYKVGDVSKEGFWEIANIERGEKHAGSTPTAEGELEGGNPVVAEGAGEPTRWEINVTTTGTEIKVAYAVIGVPATPPEPGGFGGEIGFAIAVEEEEEGEEEHAAGMDMLL